MAQSKKHQHLLKHPVIALFLWLKWKRMGAAYNRNLVMYTAFVAVLTAYIFVLYAGKAVRAGSFLTETCVNGTVTDDDATWIASLMPLGALFGGTFHNYSR